MSESWEVVVIGAGAAGLFAAARAAERGRRTLLLEKNRKAGVKILISGGTRCNVTQQTDRRGIVQAFGQHGKFLHSALSALDPAGVVATFHQEGVPTKVEPSGKIFPVSDRALDVRDALLRRLHRAGATLALDEPARSVRREGDGFHLSTSRRTLHAERLLITTGGLSYPGCGTTGDGYAWAQALGHTIMPTRPALTPLTTDVDWVRELTGLTLPDAAVAVVDPAITSAKKACLAAARGSLLLTHFGLSGPPALDVSRAVTGHAQPRSLHLTCDFVPEEPTEGLAERLRSAARREGKRQVDGIIAAWLPKRLADALLAEAELAPDRRAAELSKPQLAALVRGMKQTKISLSGYLGYKKAEVTAGGVALNEVDSRTMQSKRTPNLFFAGEILDLDGPIGGYNFQAAFSTGCLAGECA